FAPAKISGVAPKKICSSFVRCVLMLDGAYVMPLVQKLRCTSASNIVLMNASAASLFSQDFGITMTSTQDGAPSFGTMYSTGTPSFFRAFTRPRQKSEIHTSPEANN